MGDHVDEGVADADDLVAGTARCPTRRRQARRTTLPGAGRRRRQGAARSLRHDRSGAVAPIRSTGDRLPSPTAPRPVPPRQARLPRRYDVELTPDLAAATFTGTVSIAVDVVEAATTITLNADRARHREPARVDGAPATWTLEPDDRAARHHARTGRSTPGPATIDIDVHRHPQRQAARLLPQHVRRRRRQRARHRHDADAGDRLPAGVPVLGRARVQGGVRHHAGRSTRRCRPCRTAPRSRREHRARTARWRSRFADTMVMSTLPRRLRRRPARGHRRRSTSTASPLRVVPRPRQGPPHRLRPRHRRLRPALVPGLLRHPVPGRQGRPPRPARLRRRGDGEPRVHHVPRERCCSSTRPRARRASRSASPTSSPTSSPTCGSATS